MGMSEPARCGYLDSGVLGNMGKGYAGVAHQDIQPAKGGDGLLHVLLGRGKIGYLPFEQESLAAELCHPGLHCLGFSIMGTVDHSRTCGSGLAQDGISGVVVFLELGYF